MKAFLWITCLFVAVATAANKKFTLVIDAGHGGTDAGAVGSITKEKHINLNVALTFGRLVERNCPDVRVIYTRKTDVFVPLHTRADIANRNKADLFISIHTNALPKGRISRGLETYTLGMHRAADNLDVARRTTNSVIRALTLVRQRVISCLSSCRTEIWHRALTWRSMCSVAPVLRQDVRIKG